MAAMPRDASGDEVLGAGQACFRMNVEECHRCHRRPGVFFGWRGFGWRHRGHESECIRRSANIAAPPASGRPSAASAVPSQFAYASAASGRPSEAPSAAASDWQTVGRPSEAPSAAPSDWQTCREQTTPRESAVSQWTEPRGSTATQVPRDSAATQFNEPRPIDPRDSAATQFIEPRVSDTTQAVEEARGSTATQAIYSLARCSVTTQVAPDLAAFQQSKPCLHYFAFAGRGELARLIAAVGALEIDESVSTETEDNSSFGSPGSLPCLTHGELRISQSFAIESYLADIAPAYAHLTPPQRAIDSMFCKIKEDVLRSFAEVVVGQTSSSAEVITGIADKWFPVLEQELPHGGFVHGLVLPTAADLAVLNIAKAFIPFGVAYDKAQYDPLAKWPKFAAHVDRVAQYPAVEIYLQNSTSMQADPFGMRSQASEVEATAAGMGATARSVLKIRTLETTADREQFRESLTDKRVLHVKGFGSGFKDPSESQMVQAAEQMNEAIAALGNFNPDFIVVDGDPWGPGFQVYIKGFVDQKHEAGGMAPQLIWVRNLVAMDDDGRAGDPEERAKREKQAQEWAVQVPGLAVIAAWISDEDIHTKMNSLFGANTWATLERVKYNKRGDLRILTDAPSTWVKGVEPALYEMLKVVENRAEMQCFEKCGLEHAAKGHVIFDTLRNCKSTVHGAVAFGGGETVLLEFGSLYLNTESGFDKRHAAILPFSRGKEETDPKLPAHLGASFAASSGGFADIKAGADATSSSVLPDAREQRVHSLSGTGSAALILPGITSRSLASDPSPREETALEAPRIRKRDKVRAFFRRAFMCVEA